mmetsp:Transcript_17752/g.45037  ORF Transcript_17752/g.45037 Transcript_17752/m.45037 type:complete len:88 (+) Transcript_17752:331-594(+)
MRAEEGGVCGSAGCAASALFVGGEPAAGSGWLWAGLALGTEGGAAGDDEPGTGTSNTRSWIAVRTYASPNSLDRTRAQSPQRATAST